ncbi:MAG: anti-sigma factor antagonist [Roseburia sp.]
MDNSYDLQEGKLVVWVPRELDHHEAAKLRAETDLMIESYHVKKLIFDFSRTEFMDSSGIGVIIGRCRNMGYFGGEVMAQNLNERIQKIFTISGLHKMIKTI